MIARSFQNSASTWNVFLSFNARDLKLNGENARRESSKQQRRNKQGTESLKTKLWILFLFTLIIQNNKGIGMDCVSSLGPAMLFFRPAPFFSVLQRARELRVQTGRDAWLHGSVETSCCDPGKPADGMNCEGSNAVSVKEPSNNRGNG